MVIFMNVMCTQLWLSILMKRGSPNWGNLWMLIMQHRWKLSWITWWIFLESAFLLLHSYNKCLHWECHWILSMSQVSQTAIKARPHYGTIQFICFTAYRMLVLEITWGTWNHTKLSMQKDNHSKLTQQDHTECYFSHFTIFNLLLFDSAKVMKTDVACQGLLQNLSANL